VPLWLTVDSDLLTSALAWIGTATYTDERDFLSSHQDLLDPAADVAVREALLTVTEDAGNRYESLRQEAQSAGVEAAYQPLMLAILAAQFANADSRTQRLMLESRRGEVLTETEYSVLAEMAERGDAQAQQAVALLNLAALGEHESTLDALQSPSSLPLLLHRYALRPDPAALGPAAAIAFANATTPGEAATCLVYVAIAAAVAGEADHAIELLREAQGLDADSSFDWIRLLAEVGQQHREVLPLITALAQRPDQEQSEEA